VSIGIRTHYDYLKINPLDHINGFTPQTLTDMAQRAGFAPIRKPPVHITTDLVRVAKNLAKPILERAPTTQQYFIAA
jgi:hypothetical protein